MKKVMIVTTSIGDEAVFKRFFRAYARVDVSSLHAKLLVVGDKNTACTRFSHLPEHERLVEKGFEFEYLGVEEQTGIMQSKPYMEDLIPWKRIQRRNIGYLSAYKSGYDVVVTVDDDNFPINESFLKDHLANLTADNLRVLHPKKDRLSWFNPCSVLPNHIVHRGFPIEHRYDPMRVMEKTNMCGGTVVVSEGFWIGDPDIDAIARIEGNPRNTRVGKISQLKNFCVSGRLLSPFNSQNTAFRREVIPTLFLSSKIGRYDDIWASYFLKALLYVTGDFVMYGKPIVRQERNAHNSFNDLKNEIFGMQNTKAFVDELMEFVLNERDGLLKLSYFNMAKKVSEVMLRQSVKFNWYYLDILRWLELLETSL